MIALHELFGVASVRPVCRDGAQAIRFDAFRARVTALASRFAAMRERRYALCIDDPYDFACALFALFAAGKEPVIPANATAGHLADLSEAFDVVLRDADLGTDREQRPAPALTIDAHAPLTLYTSGTSGAPKPIRKTLAQLDAEVRTLEAEWGERLGGATILASVPHHHIYGLLFRVFWPLAAGRPFDRATCAEPAQLRARIVACGACAVVSSPAHLARWPLIDGFAHLAPLCFFSSGGPLARDVALRYADAFGAAPVEVFGSTETGGIAWRRQSETDAWTPLHGVQTRLHDTGALAVRSPHLGHDRWHLTDDAARFDGEGRFRLLGRLDRVLKLDGKRVSLTELEARLAQHPYVRLAAVVGLEGKERGKGEGGGARERLGAVIVLSDEGAAAWSETGRNGIARTLRRHLADYIDVALLPRHWRFRAALPFDARGKLPASALAAEFAAREHGPEVLAEVRTGETIAFDLRVPATLSHFAGHFPGLPILPGVVQIDWAIRLAERHAPRVRHVTGIERLKFLAPVSPGASLRLTLDHSAANARVRFQYRMDARECASGVIVYRGDEA
jgi:acyl-coenzyme A synthetase/AMP-(fatty) acid ligase/3-hydroxymyristoyl/3-hydroxydecanoyl-(acyl carrier protein) dehydratase